MTRRAPRVLCSRAVSVSLPATCGNPGRPWPSRRGPAQAFRRSHYVPVLPRYCAGPLAVRSKARLAPTVDASLAGFKEVSYYHRVNGPAGLSNRCTKDTVRWLWFLRYCRQRWGRCIQATGDRGFYFVFPASGLCSPRVRAMGLWSRSPRERRREHGREIKSDRQRSVCRPGAIAVTGGELPAPFP